MIPAASRPLTLAIGEVPSADQLLRWLRTVEEPAIASPTRHLPMPVKGDSDKLSYVEWADYRFFRDRQHSADPTYEHGWKRPSYSTAAEVWGLLQQHLHTILLPRRTGRRVRFSIAWDGNWETWGGPIPKLKSLAPDAIEEAEQTIKLAALVAINHAVNCGETGRMLTQGSLLEELARYWSDHYRAVHERNDTRRRATSLYDVLPETHRGVRRDLIRNRIAIGRLWTLITRLIPGQFADDDQLYTVTQTKRAEGGYTVTLPSGGAFLTAFNSLVRGDRNCRQPKHKERVSPATETAPTARLPWKVCGERAFDTVEIGKRSKDLIDAMGKTRLLLSTSGVLGYFGQAWGERDIARGELLKVHGIKPWHIPKLGANERLDWATGLAIKAAKRKFSAGEREDLKERLRPLLRRHDLSDQIIVSYGGVRSQIYLEGGDWSVLGNIFTDDLTAGQDTFVEIQTTWYKTLNRRYQTASLWPLSVTSKKPLRDLPSIDVDFVNESMRKRWFRVPGAAGGEPQPLVTLDVAASQAQIYAVLLNSKELEAAALQPGYRRLLLERALLTVSAADYPEGEDSERLQALVKKLNMVPAYDSQVRETIRKMSKDTDTYGPGLSVEAAETYLKTTPGFGDIELFKEACRRVAHTAYHGDKRLPKGLPLRETDHYRGVIFADPFDGSRIRWNPVRRCHVDARSDGLRFSFSPPGRFVTTKYGRAKRNEIKAKWKGAKGWKADWQKFKKTNRLKTTGGGACVAFRLNKPHPITGDWPIDPGKMTRRIAPCTIHTLDGLFSSLVLEKLAELGIPATGFHDAWAVPETVLGGRKGTDVLAEVIAEAGQEWLESLGSIYDMLDKYLGADQQLMDNGQQTYSEYTRGLRAAWEQRKLEKRWPTFYVPNNEREIAGQSIEKEEAHERDK